MYVNNETGEVVILSELANRLNMNIPVGPSPEVLESLGLAVLVETAPPTAHHTLGPNQLIGGKWRTTWYEPEAAVLKQAKLVEINAQCEQRLRALRASYPASEVLSWDKQEAEARVGGGPFTRALAEARGLTLDDLLERILAKADAYASISAKIIGIRQHLESKMAQTSSIAEISAIQWPEDA
ncbi:hypothetical protein [Metapseudomonas otitidis]|uniref:hypothetical protein n=1 Tax=Metapseudomonas otitidis TaxID=319939 RepID=UPI00244B7544|nr:hypothetical protein [Pseudomonas otitidis]MDG9780256.1 hypothetical protein [Pseudomonas otitidis]